jgi:hypothetical protein
MTGVYEIVYTSAPKLLQSGRADLGVVAATEGTPPSILQRSVLFRSYPTSSRDRTPSDGELPIRCAIQKDDSGVVVGVVRDADVDHTGRSNILSHELHVTKEFFDNWSGGSPRLSDLLESALPHLNRSSWTEQPKWLPALSLAAPSPMKADAARESLLELLDCNSAAGSLSCLAAQQAAVLDIAAKDWNRRAPKVLSAILRCLPPHLQANAMALSDRGINTTQWLLQLQPSQNLVGTEGTLHPQTPDTVGYGQAFINDKLYYIRSFWTKHALVGQSGWSDFELARRFEQSQNASNIPAKLQGCDTGIKNAQSSSLKEHFRKWQRSVLNDKTMSPSDLVACCKYLTENSETRKKEQELLLRNREVIESHKDNLDHELLDSLARWRLDCIKDDSIQKPPSEFDRIVKKHFEKLWLIQQDDIEILVTFFAPNDVKDIEKMAWGFKEGRNGKKYLSNGVQWIIQESRRPESRPKLDQNCIDFLRKAYFSTLMENRIDDIDDEDRIYKIKGFMERAVDRIKTPDFITRTLHKPDSQTQGGTESRSMAKNSLWESWGLIIILILIMIMGVFVGFSFWNPFSLSGGAGSTNNTTNTAADTDAARLQGEADLQGAPDATKSGDGEGDK